MKVLIIGKNSYIGNHIDQWLQKYGWNVDQLDVLHEDWRDFDYSPYDAIVNVAAIVHRPDCKNWELYKKVNTDMPIGIATKAKSQGVKTFVFLSSMAVYGKGKELRSNVIDETTPLRSESMYGKSKLLAEEGLNTLQDMNFNVVCVRPPSVYGKDCRGGYIKGFVSVVKRLPIIPKAYTDVKQSMLYIDNLSEFVKLAVEQNRNGAFAPQDDRSVSANDVINAIAKGMGKKLRVSNLLGAFVYLFHFIPIIKKAYGGIEYSKKLSTIEGMNYCVVTFDEGMQRTLAIK